MAWAESCPQPLWDPGLVQLSGGKYCLQGIACIGLSIKTLGRITFYVIQPESDWIQTALRENMATMELVVNTRPGTVHGEAVGP